MKVLVAARLSLSPQPLSRSSDEAAQDPVLLEGHLDQCLAVVARLRSASVAR